MVGKHHYTSTPLTFWLLASILLPANLLSASCQHPVSPQWTFCQPQVSHQSIFCQPPVSHQPTSCQPLVQLPVSLQLATGQHTCQSPATLLSATSQSPVSLLWSTYQPLVSLLSATNHSLVSLWQSALISIPIIMITIYTNLLICLIYCISLVFLSFSPFLCFHSIREGLYSILSTWGG